MQLISDNYKKMQQVLHERGNYGTASLGFGGVVSDILNKTGAETLLDYGCGSMQNLRNVLQPARSVQYNGYDPAVDEYAEKPDPADIVVSIDVLEHIEPEFLDNVLDDIQALARYWCFLSVHTGPARKVLADGRNAHLIQEKPGWWLERICKRWDLLSFQKTEQGFMVLCQSLRTQS